MRNPHNFIPAKAGIQPGRRPSAGLNENETLACTYCRVFLESRLETAAVKVPFTLEHIAPNPAWPRAAFEH